jgi:hypothetical protein
MHEKMPGAYLDLSTPGDPRGVVVAGNMPNDIFKDYIGPILGTFGPMLASAFIPGLGLSPLGNILAGAGVGGAGAGLRGENILKGAAMGGLGAAGGQYLGPVIGDAANIGLRAGTAIGTGLGSTAGGLLTGQNLKDSLLGGVASGALSYVTPDITKGLGIGQGTSASTGGGDNTVSLSGSGPAPIVVSGYNTPSLGLSVGSASPRTNTVEPKPLDIEGGTTISGTNAPVGGLSTLANTPLGSTVDSNIINVLGSPLINGTGINIGNIGGGGLSTVTATDLAPKTNVTATEDNPITVTGNGSTLMPSVNVPIGTNTSSISDVNLKPLTDGTKTDDDTITVTGGKTIPGVVAPFGSGDIKPIDLTKTDLTEAEKKKLELEDYLRLSSKVVGLLGNLVGDGGEDAGSAGTYGGGGTGRLNPIFSAKLPSAGGLGTIGANRTVRPMGDVDWLTYGQRPELNFYDYAAQAALPTPVTQPIPNNPAGPIMADRDPTRFAKGGRTEFAVNGLGTGRSDDIPAVLSDGEYVIDAETVALLGDGSSKAGAKKLDELRVKVRKHKGKKLAKGRFSANAKKPEAYLSGGRI